MATEALQRSGPGLWFSPCGRLSIRRLATGQWAVSSVGSADRVGGFTARVSGMICAQRFSSLKDAREAMTMALRLAGEEIDPARPDWYGGVRTAHSVKMAGGGQQELHIKLTHDGRLWKISAGPIYEPAGDDRSLFDSLMLQRLSYFLGQARTAREAQEIVAQELSLPWPEIRA